jgi:hypothetical protein
VLHLQTLRLAPGAKRFKLKDSPRHRVRTAKVSLPSIWDHERQSMLLYSGEVAREVTGCGGVIHPAISSSPVRTPRGMWSPELCNVIRITHSTQKGTGARTQVSTY